MPRRSLPAAPRLGGDLKDDLAPAMARIQPLVGLAHLLEREDGIHDDPGLSALEQRRHLAQPRPFTGQEGAVEGLVLGVEASS